MNREALNETIMNHAKYLNGDADGVRANLRGADIDYSCWPIWCGSLDVVVDKWIAVQLAYHFCRLICDDPEYISARNSLINFANQFHRVEECGKLERYGQE